MSPNGSNRWTTEPVRALNCPVCCPGPMNALCVTGACCCDQRLMLLRPLLGLPGHLLCQAKVHRRFAQKPCFFVFQLCCCMKCCESPDISAGGSMHPPPPKYLFVGGGSAGRAAHHFTRKKVQPSCSAQNVSSHALLGAHSKRGSGAAAVTWGAAVGHNRCAHSNAFVFQNTHGQQVGIVALYSFLLFLPADLRLQYRCTKKFANSRNSDMM